MRLSFRPIPLSSRNWILKKGLWFYPAIYEAIRFTLHDMGHRNSFYIVKWTFILILLWIPKIVFRLPFSLLNISHASFSHIELFEMLQTSLREKSLIRHSLWAVLFLFTILELSYSPLVDWDSKANI